MTPSHFFFSFSLYPFYLFLWLHYPDGAEEKDDGERRRGQEESTDECAEDGALQN